MRNFATASDKRRIVVTADRGFADVTCFALLDDLGIKFIIRVKSGTNVHFQGRWCRLGQIQFRGHERHRHLGSLLYCERSPQRLWVSKSRARDSKGNWGIWYLLSNHPYDAKAAAEEDGGRFGCEAGCRDANWWLGFAKARITQFHAWSRLFAWFAIALLVRNTLGSELLVVKGQGAISLLRRVVSRRRGRCELGLVSAVISLLQCDSTLYEAFDAHGKLRLDGMLANVS